MKCHECKGTGETEVWNPVLPKGRLTFTGKPVASQGEILETPSPNKEPGVGKDRLFTPEPHRMQDLLRELAAKGVGGKR